MKHALVPLAFLPFASLAAADVLDVGGPSPDHAQISAAVAAAQDGDVIRVWPGTYQPFTIANLSLTVVPAESGGAAQVAGTIRVEDLAPGRTVALTGISATSADGPALVVSDCLGSVRVREGVFVAQEKLVFGWAVGFDGVSLTNASDVELTYCTARGGGPPSCDECGGPGGNGLFMQDSVLSAYTSHFEGAHGGTEDDPGASGGSGGDGILALGGIAYVSGCTLVGGDGSNADFDPDFFGDYGHGGDGGYGFRGFGASAWFLDDEYEPGFGGWGPLPGHFGAPGQPHSPGVELPGRARIGRVSALVDDATSIDLRFVGEPGDEVLVRFAEDAGYALSPVYGPLLLALPPTSLARPFVPGAGWRHVGTIGPSGVLLSSLPARELPPFGHELLHVQAVFLGDETYYGAASWCAVLDSAW